MSEQIATGLLERDATEGLTMSGTLSETGSATSDLTKEIGYNRDVARVLKSDFDDLHHQSLNVDWRRRTMERGKTDVPGLLEELSDLGFAWTAIAKLIGVSAPAIHKWRRGGSATGASRGKLAGLLAACDIIHGSIGVDNVASWFEMPVLPHVPVTPIDMYAADRADLVFDFAKAEDDPEALMDQFNPEWRERYRTDFTPVKMSDGNWSLQMKD